ncbi:MAG: hypothetical protein K9K75_00095 [Deltaproteobacteria bacterium]|nr:hypothetical protein [Deltaproteobacteria bacterium]
MATKIASELPKENFDKRVLQKSFLAVSVSKKELSEHLRSLPDLASEAAVMETVLEEDLPEEESTEEC